MGPDSVASNCFSCSAVRFSAGLFVQHNTENPDLLYAMYNPQTSQLYLGYCHRNLANCVSKLG